MMNEAKKNKALISIIIFLLFTNIAMLIFFMVLKDPARRGHGNKNFISTVLKKDVGFGKEQLDQFENLRKDHLQKIHPLFNEIKGAKDSLYNLLYVSDVPDSIINNRAAVIGEKQMALDMQMFRHLKSVRRLCTAQQQPKFDSAIKTVVAKMIGGFKRDNKNH